MPGEQQKSPEEKYRIFKELYKEFPSVAIMKRLDLTSDQFNRFLTRAILHENKQKNNERVRLEKTPFSNEEEDYGSIKATGYMIRKYGRLEGVPMPMTPPTLLSKAANNYKQSLIR